MKFIDEKTIQNLVHQEVFEQGLDHYRQDHVQRLIIKGNTIHAHVIESSSDYKVILKHTKSQFEGSCDCPDSDNFDFCRHCVAVSLAYLARLEQKQKLAKTKKADLLEKYLLGLDKHSLVKRLLDLVKGDRELKRLWQMEAEIMAGKFSHKEIRKHITSATPKRYCYRYAEAAKYFKRLENVLHDFKKYHQQFRAEESLELVIHGYERMDKALETVDDSGGFRYTSLDILSDILRHSFVTVAWSSEQKAEFLFANWCKPINDLMPAIPDDFHDDLGKEGIGHFISLVENRLQEMTPLSRIKPGDDRFDNWEYRYEYKKYTDILATQAKKEKRVDDLISLWANTAMSVLDYLNMSQLCLQHNKVEQSIQWLNKSRTLATAEKSYNFNQKNDIIEQEIRILYHQKAYQKVLDLEWERFQSSPNLAHYKCLKKAAEKAQSDEDFYSKCIELLYDKADRQRGHGSNIERGLGFYESMAQIQLYEKKTETVLETAKQYQLSVETLHKIAKLHLPNREKTLPLYQRLAISHINIGGRDHYQIACAYLNEANKHYDEEDRKVLYALIEQIAIENKHKPALIEELQKSFKLQLTGLRNRK